MTSREWRQRLERPHTNESGRMGVKKGTAKGQADKQWSTLADVTAVCCYIFKRRKSALDKLIPRKSRGEFQRN